MKNFFLISFLTIYFLPSYPAPPFANIWYGSLNNTAKKLNSFTSLPLSISSTEALTVSAGPSYVYIGGNGFVNQNYYGCLWVFDPGKNKVINQTQINQTMGFQVSGSSTGQNTYLVGPKDTVPYGDYNNSQASLYITDQKGNNPQEIFLTSNYKSYAMSCFFFNGKIYSVGFDSNPFLWITNGQGGDKLAIQLSSAATGASDVVASGNKCYVVGQDLFNSQGSGYYLSALWIRDLQGNSLQDSLKLDGQLPSNVDDSSYAVSCALGSNNMLYSAGEKQLLNDQGGYTLQPCLYITDFSQATPQTTVVQLDQLNKESSNVNAICVDGNYCYLVGGNSLWVYDLDGKFIQSVIFQDAQELSSVVAFNNTLYIVGNKKGGSLHIMQRYTLQQRTRIQYK